MIVDNEFVESLLAKAKSNPRLRENFDLRTSDNDTSQRMLNALLPGTVVPIHRHCQSSETVVCLRGSLIEVFYDDKGVECARYELNPRSGLYALQIPAGCWHSVIVIEPCVIFESKDGPYVPLASDDVLASD